MCEVEELDTPIGFEVTGSVYGLSVQYEELDELEMENLINTGISQMQSTQNKTKSKGSRSMIRKASLL